MSDSVEALILDLLEWMVRGRGPMLRSLKPGERPVRLLPVWEEAKRARLLMREHQETVGAAVAVSPSGREFIEAHRRSRLRLTRGARRPLSDASVLHAGPDGDL